MKKGLIFLIIIFVVIFGGFGIWKISFPKNFNGDANMTPLNNSLNEAEDIVENSENVWLSWQESWAIISGPESATDLMIYAGKENTLHVVSGDYYNNKRCELRYAFYDGETWSDELIPSSSTFYGEEADIVVDSNNNPHIVFIDDVNTEIYYAAKENGIWDLELITKATSFMLDAGIDLDNAENPHVVFDTCASGEDYDYDSKPSKGKCALWYAYKEGEVWNVEEIVEEEIKVRSVAVDSLNRVHTAFGTEDDKEIYYAVKENGIWNVEKVDDDWMEGSDIGVDVNSENSPHLIYKKTNGEVIYRVKKNGVWDIEILDEVEGEEEAMRVFVDEDNIVHVYYGSEDIKNDELSATYQYNEGVWNKEVINGGGGEGDISVKNGIVYICFGSELEKSQSEEEIEYVKCIWKNFL